MLLNVPKLTVAFHSLFHLDIVMMDDDDEDFLTPGDFDALLGEATQVMQHRPPHQPQPVSIPAAQPPAHTWGLAQTKIKPAALPPAISQTTTTTTTKPKSAPTLVTKGTMFPSWQQRQQQPAARKSLDDLLLEEEEDDADLDLAEVINEAAPAGGVVGPAPTAPVTMAASVSEQVRSPNDDDNV